MSIACRQPFGLFRRFTREADGASAVEFALVLPVFLLIVVGVLCYGIYYATVHSVQHLTAEAARRSVAGLTLDERKSLANESVAAALPEYRLLNPHKMSPPHVDRLPSNPDLFEVRLSYDSSDLPIWLFEDFIPLPPKIIDRVAIVRRGGY